MAPTRRIIARRNDPIRSQEPGSTIHASLVTNVSASLKNPVIWPGHERIEPGPATLESSVALVEDGTPLIALPAAEERAERKSDGTVPCTGGLTLPAGPPRAAITLDIATP